MQEPELTAKMPRKCSFQDHWLKDSAYQDLVLKDKLDRYYAWCMACEIQLIFCVPYKRWSLQNLTLVLTSPYKGLIWLWSRSLGIMLEHLLLLLLFDSLMCGMGGGLGTVDGVCGT